MKKVKKTNAKKATRVTFNEETVGMSFKVTARDYNRLKKISLKTKLSLSQILRKLVHNCITGAI